MEITRGETESRRATTIVLVAAVAAFVGAMALLVMPSSGFGG